MRISIKKFSLFLTTTLAISLVSFAQDTEKLVTKKWKMVQTLQNDEEIDPKHSNLVITLEKNKTFSISASREVTHEGTWKLSDDKKSIIFSDKTSNEENTYSIETLDKKHLSLGGYDGNTTIALIPFKKGHKHLSHKEALVAKEWHVYKTDKEENMDMLIHFKKDKSFIFVPYGYKMPVASGRWRLNEDQTIIILEMLAENQELKLDILEAHRHEFVLKNEKTGIVNYLHDRKLYAKDKKNSKKKDTKKEASESAAE